MSTPRWMHHQPRNTRWHVVRTQAGLDPDSWGVERHQDGLCVTACAYLCTRAEAQVVATALNAYDRKRGKRSTETP